MHWLYTYILKYAINIVPKHMYTNTDHIHFQFALLQDMNDGLRGSVSGLLELFILIGL
jgi:hypothetical protein